MTQVVVDESAKIRADEERVGAQDYLGLVRDSAIDNDADASAAVELAKEIKRQIARIDETKKFFVDPLKRVVRTYENYFREPLDLLKDCERELKSKIAAYVRRKHEDNQRALAAAARTTDAQEAREVLATITPAANPKDTSIRYRWVFEVTDPDAVPRELCSPDNKKIGAAFAVGENGQPMPIPGVAWRQEPVVSVRK